MRKNIFIEYAGKKQTISEWARELNISTSTISLRLKAGHNVDKVLSKDGLHNRFIEFSGKRQTMSQWSRELGVSLQTICSRVHRGLPLELVFSKGKL